MKDISGQLKEIRLARGLSLHQVARRADTSPATLFRYENGWKRFEVYTLNKIASALGCRLKIDFEHVPSPGLSAGSAAVVRRLKRLFWDCPLKAEHFRRFPAWVVERVLGFGSLRDVQTIIQFFGRRKFIEIVGGIQFKSDRTKIFWQNILKKENVKCTQKRFRQEVGNFWQN